MRPEFHIRLCEWSAVPVPEWMTVGQREALAEAAETWRRANHLPVVPLWFSGPNGGELCVRQYVGVVEVAGVCVEIYPKLDRCLLKGGRLRADVLAQTAMANLLWMLEVCESLGVSEADTAHLEEQSVSFYDVFAYLMAKGLLSELAVGVPHAYRSLNDVLPAVKGRLDLVEQVTTQWNRFDRTACVWDEFTADLPVNRMFKCACQLLCTRVASPMVWGLLTDCLAFLESAADVDPLTALRDVDAHRWDRSNERFRLSSDMAYRLLAGSGYTLSGGSSQTFVFLLDMNGLFERYVGAVVASRFGVPVEEQTVIGTLFCSPDRLEQKPDCLWRTGARRWIGDAKYKHLAKGQEDALSFDTIALDEREQEAVGIRADQAIDAGDVRQLTVYSELLRRGKKLAEPPDIVILYPFVGSGCFATARARAWNGAQFHLAPVRVTRQSRLADALPAEGWIRE